MWTKPLCRSAAHPSWLICYLVVCCLLSCLLETSYLHITLWKEGTCNSETMSSTMIKTNVVENCTNTWRINLDFRPIWSVFAVHILVDSFHRQRRLNRLDRCQGWSESLYNSAQITIICFVLCSSNNREPATHNWICRNILYELLCETFFVAIRNSLELP